MYERESNRLFRIDLGRTKFKRAWEVQKRLVELRYEGRIPDCLILTEHEPVITMGRGSSRGNLLCSPEELLKRGIELYEIERGGDITFHGPGQLVVYPIVHLNGWGRDLHKYLRDLEKVVIETFNEHGLRATSREGLTGVWVDDHKLAAIGVAVSRWVAYHGLAINISTDLDYFKLINPCGITEFPVGSMASMLGKKIDLKIVADTISGNFAKAFHYETRDIEDINSLYASPAEV